MAVFDPIVPERPGDGGDLARSIGATRDPRQWAGLIPLIFGAQRPYPSQHFRRPMIFNITGPNGQAQVFAGATPAQGHIRYVEVVGGTHNDPAARTLNLGIRTTLGGTGLDINIAQQLAAAASTFVFQKSLVLNEIQDLFVNAIALAAGQAATIQAIMYDVFVGEDFITL